MAIAIGINEMIHKRTAKYFQTCMILPTFISYIAITFIVKAFLQSDIGIINRFRLMLGLQSIRFYQNSEYWPVILLIVKLWKGIGYGSVLYLSALAGFDQQIYEAADIDGATAWQKLWRITIPMLMPTVIVMTLLGLGNIMHSETGLFYQVTQNNAMLYNTTQVLDSFVLNALMKNTDYGMTSAATFYQSVVGFIMVMATNWFVRKASPDDALF
ncbi:MAG: ABC transporter permease subunit [Acutalibacteraceae bacterium]